MATMDEVVKEVMFMLGILKLVQPEVREVCTIIYEENKGAIQLAHNSATIGKLC